jgi:hypothetical protein
MTKSIYLAGKIDSNELSVESFAIELESRGHDVIEQWWKKGRLPKPYLDYPDTSVPASEAMIEAAMNCEVFILFPEDDILGAAVELGAAIASTVEKPLKDVVVVNPYEVRQSVFYIHPSVVAVEGIHQVRQMYWY